MPTKKTGRGSQRGRGRDHRGTDKAGDGESEWRRSGGGRGWRWTCDTTNYGSLGFMNDNKATLEGFFLKKLNTFPNQDGKGEVSKEWRGEKNPSHHPLSFCIEGSWWRVPSHFPGAWLTMRAVCSPSGFTCGRAPPRPGNMLPGPATQDALHLECYCHRGFQSLPLAWKSWGIHAKRQNKLHSAAAN